MIVVLNVFMISIYLLLTIFHCTWHGPADMCLWFSARVCSHNEFRKWLLWVNVLTILEDAEVNQRVIGPEGRGLYRKWIEAAIPHYWQRSILWCPFWEHPPFNRWILLHDCLRPFVCNSKQYMNAAEGRKFQINTSSSDSHVRYLLPGYFIVKGVERVLMMQEQARDRMCWREIYRARFCQHRCCFGKPFASTLSKNETTGLDEPNCCGVWLEEDPPGIRDFPQCRGLTWGGDTVAGD